jgi:hypothetical protein
MYKKRGLTVKARKNYSFLFLSMIVFVLLVSACTSITTNTGTKSTLTPAQIIQKSATAMKNLKSSHIETKSTISAASAATGAQASQTSSTPTAVSTNITETGSGDQQGKDQQLNLTTNVGPQSIKLAEVVKGNNVYIQNQLGKWYVLNASQMSGQYSSMFSGITIDQNSLLGVLQDIKVVDHNDENVNGTSLRHLTASLDKNALTQLLEQDTQLKSSLGQQTIDEVISSAKEFSAVVDVWISETNFYVYQSQFKLNIVADPSKVSKSAPSVGTTTVNSTINLSKFNDPVTITAPSNATPTTNPATIFGVSQ